MLEIQVNDNEFNEIKNSFIYDYSDIFIIFELTNIIKEWNKFKDNYFICFSNKKKWEYLLWVIRNKYNNDKWWIKIYFKNKIKVYKFNVKHLGSKEV